MISGIFYFYILMKAWGKMTIHDSNVREKLLQLGSQKRYNFTAEYARCGYKVTYRRGLDRDKLAPTIMFKNVKINNNLVTDHLWFNYTKGFAELGKLIVGDVISFNARVASYEKLGHKIDYKLERPTKVKLVFHKSAKDALPIPNTTKGKNELLGYIMLENKKFYQENNRPYYPWYVERYKKFLDQKIF